MLKKTSWGRPPGPHLLEGKTPPTPSLEHTYVRSLKCSALEKVHFSSH